MTERMPELAPNNPEKRSGGTFIESFRTGDRLPGIELKDENMRMKLHALMEKAGRLSGPIRFSTDSGVIYVSFPDLGETLILRGVTLGGISPDYTGKGDALKFNDQAVSKVRNYLERKKSEKSIRTSLSNLSSEFSESA